MFPRSSVKNCLLSLLCALCVLCTPAAGSAEQEQRLDQIISDYMAIPNKEMWSQRPVVNVSHPFIFFHQRKAGGTSIRYTLFHTAKKLELHTFIPCFSAPCDTYVFPHHSNKTAIFAGHFLYGEQHELARWGASREFNFSCTTNFRAPVDRIVSCIYFRFRVLLNGTCLSKLSSAALKDFMFKRDSFGDSCLNEPFYIMSGFRDRSYLDTLDDLRRRRLYTHGAVTVFEMTLSHVERCAPVVLEIPESYALMSLRFPQLVANGAFNSTQRENVLKKKCPELSGAHLDLIKQHSKLEQRLYDAVYQKVLSAVEELRQNPIYPISTTHIHST